MSVRQILVIKILLIHIFEKFRGYVEARCIADYSIRITLRAQGSLTSVDKIDNFACREYRAAAKTSSLTRRLNLRSMRGTVFMNCV